MTDQSNGPLQTMLRLAGRIPKRRPINMREACASVTPDNSSASPPPVEQGVMGLLSLMRVRLRVARLDLRAFAATARCSRWWGLFSWAPLA
jgi:hypothetical protein